MKAGPNLEVLHDQSGRREGNSSNGDRQTGNAYHQEEMEGIIPQFHVTGSLLDPISPARWAGHCASASKPQILGTGCERRRGFATKEFNCTRVYALRRSAVRHSYVTGTSPITEAEYRYQLPSASTTSLTSENASFYQRGDKWNVTGYRVVTQSVTGSLPYQLMANWDPSISRRRLIISELTSWACGGHSETPYIALL
ncbi:unnamed protein product [Nezara viridula]|uniref:Uncharacterized protein n=1 Tax=Nezara viridula TaxID=85310 RepID=A0A9P0H751_NEZVI|nr:unnamed protein product [Nezara viridula]